MQNKHVYDKIFKELEKSGFEKSGTQCRDKIKKLKGEYKKIKDSNRPTGTGRKSGKYFDKLNEILGNKPATMPYAVVDTSADHDAQDSDVESGLTGTKEGETTSSSMQHCNEGQHSGSNGNDESEQNDVSNTSCTSSCTDSDTSNKRKRPKKIDKVDKITSIIDKMVQLQEASDKMFCTIEEKRLKLEEEAMRMEEARQKETWEREDRKRKEEQEFQLKMMQIMCSSRSPIQSPPFSLYGFDSITRGTRGSTPTSSIYEWQQNSPDMIDK